MATAMELTTVHTDGVNDGTYVVKPLTIVAFERQFGVGLGSLLSDQKMEYVYWLAWHSEKTAGKVVKPFDGWLEGVESVEMVDDDAAPLD